MHAYAIRRALPAAAAVLSLGLATAAPVVLIGANDYGLTAPVPTRTAG